ncbi:MAG: DUF2252 domain-containing protein [Acidimicrobiia bacterium]
MTAPQSIDERYAKGKALRKVIPRSSHQNFVRSPDVDPVALLQSQEVGRLPQLVPIRHERMGENAYAFYRAGAKLMATDLSGTPTTNLMVQASGDAHLANFGWYGSPERNLVFDTNDFDETLPASFEWDVKRLAASFVIACEDNGIDNDDRESVARHAVRAYRDAMNQFASSGYLDTWYAHISADRVLDEVQGSKKDTKRMSKMAKKAKRKDSRHVLSKLAEEVDGEFRILDDRPWLVPSRVMGELVASDDVSEVVEEALDSYLETVSPYMKTLLSRYTIVDAALKVVGVGSVGTRCFIVLLQGRDSGDPLFLQLKEANDSVLTDFFPDSEYEHNGERVVQGQRLMQTNTDSFLGWTTSRAGAQYYVRQLKDMKASVDIEDFGPKRMKRYATACSWTLAQCHARSGDAAVLSGYMGTGDVFADAVTGFAVACAVQNGKDWKQFAEQVGFDGSR